MVLNNKLFITIIFIFTLISLQNAYSNSSLIKDQIDPYCNGQDLDKFLEERRIDSIEIRTHKNKQWSRNLLRALVEFNRPESKTHNKNLFNFRLGDKYKKKFRSTLIVNFKEKNLSCRFKAKIRMTGDGHWHIGWKQGHPLASIFVQLEDGHINSITRFKLLLPESRGGTQGEKNNKGAENEVFVASLLQELGFLAPRTYIVSAKVNGVFEKYIFQENIGKEFLENFHLREGPILEGDERFTVMKKEEYTMPALALSRLSNRRFSLKGETNGRIALTAVSNLNLIYLQNHQIKNPSKLPGDILYINTEKFFFNKSNKEKFQTYEALIYALGADHGQSGDDRRFYFDPINKHYVPIYYDGKANIFNQNTELIDKLPFTFFDAKQGSLKAIKLINDINHDNFRKKLINSGLNISSKEYGNLIKKIIYNLELIKEAEILEVEFLRTNKYFSNLEEEIVNDKKLIFVNFQKKEFYFCNFNHEKCNTKKSAGLEFSNLLGDILSQRYKDLENPSSMEYLFVYDDIDYEKEKNLKQYPWRFAKINKDFILKYNNEINVDIFPEKKEIKIQQLSNYGRAIISGKMIDGWSILFSGSEEIEPQVPNDYMGLTGCLTLLDIKVKNLKISSENSTCEDSINFIRVEGSVTDLNISNSIQDAIDLDFSNIKIDNVEITYAGNDCLDLSYGNYEINKINAKNCGDKAISIGEKSVALLKKVKISDSNIAVAVKDSSVARVENSEIYNSPICFAAYRKKLEFSGGKINVLKTNCKNDQFFAQKGSKIISNL